GEAQPRLDLPRLAGPSERRPQVVVLGLEPVEPPLLVRADQLRLGGGREREEVLGVAPRDRLALPGRPEPFQREPPQRLVHAEPCLPGTAARPLDEALVDERGEGLDGVERRRAKGEGRKGGRTAPSQAAPSPLPASGRGRWT